MNFKFLFTFLIVGLLYQPSISLAAAGIQLNTTAQPETTATGQPIWGWADLHAHQFSNLGFGGRLFVGEPQGSPETALKDSIPEHGIWGIGDTIGNFLRTGNPIAGHKLSGYPEFKGWPAWDSFNHQMMYYKWLERAYLGGQKLMVVHAVSNELLCEGHGPLSGRNCQDMPAVNMQIGAAWAMQGYIDRQDDGTMNGSGWYKIALSSDQARQIINDGDMAVIIGIEVDTLFSCYERTNCRKAHIEQNLQQYHQMGVRHVFPMHVFDNAFGGAAVYEDTFNVGNKIINKHFFDVQQCVDGNDFTLRETSPLIKFFSLIMLGVNVGTPGYQVQGSHCNTRGLTQAGKDLIDGLMSRGMLIDIDHMSNVMFDEVLSLAQLRDYPLVASHSTPQGIVRFGNRAEGRRTDAQLQAIHDLGGMVALNLSSKSRSQLNTYSSPANNVAFTCSYSSQGWAQSYLYTVDLMQGSGYLSSVGMGTDFNGFVTTPAPRFGSDACGGREPSQDNVSDTPPKIQYPFQAHGKAGEFEKQRSGGRVFNYNNAGLAHVGLLPDFIQELKVQGMTDAQLVPLFSSAEKYLQMWEKAELVSQSSLPEPSEPPAAVLVTTSEEAGEFGWFDGDLVVTLTLEEEQDYTSIFYELLGARNEDLTDSGSNEVTLSLSDTGETILNYYSYNSVSGKKSDSSSIIYSIDNDYPQISVVERNPLLEGSHWYTESPELLIDALDFGSGIRTIYYNINAIEDLELEEIPSTSLTIEDDGEYSIEIWAVDFTGKESEHVVKEVKFDSTPPTVTISLDSEPNDAGWFNTFVRPEAVATDELSGPGQCELGVEMIDGADQTASITCFDVAGNEATGELGGINIDTVPPQLSCEANPSKLWPANNRLVDVNNSVVFTDNLSEQDKGSVLLVDIDEGGSSRQPTSLGDGWELNSFDVNGQLLATKSATPQQERVYMLNYRGTDLAGNTANCDAIVTVPWSMGNDSDNSGKGKSK